MIQDYESITDMRRKVQKRLLTMRNSEGFWEGHLSSSALSTATALCALSLYQRDQHKKKFSAIVDGGFRWLADNQNEDGGWGDTIDSPSNISTTVLCWAALNLSEPSETTIQASNGRAEQWIRNCAGGLTPSHIAKAIDNVYGSDRTFSVPILTMCVLSGRFGTDSQVWSCIKPLPFELAACPHQWFRWLGLSVVSYALPALIAIGQVRHHYKPTRNPITRLLRSVMRATTLRKLESIQPASGGFLEATPLTSFVMMSLIAMGLVDHPVVVRGLKFLSSSARDDGSWPIDTNLATWVTTLSINALTSQEGLAGALDQNERSVICDWLLDQQYKVEHPYTHAAAGGWAWTDLSGGVPDADDTAGALIAIKNLALADKPKGSTDIGRVIQSEPGAQATGADQTTSNVAPRARAWGSDINNESSHAHTSMGMVPDHTNSGITLADKPPVAPEYVASTPVASEQTGSAQVARDIPNRDREGAAPDTLHEKIKSSAIHGVKWLIDLQNKDGGIPTFCRGWGKLPFDQSTPDLTAHVLRAWSVWKDEMPDDLLKKMARATNRAIRFLLQNQTPDGSWNPLWFGNQSAPGQHNPVYGTSRVIRVDEGIVKDQSQLRQWIDAHRRGIDWMISVQNEDGGWGGDRNIPSSIEETALAVDALAHCLLTSVEEVDEKIRQAVDRGYQWLVEHTQSGTKFDPSPIGLYFAKLWYKEDLYPIVLTLSAIGQVQKVAKKHISAKIMRYA